MVAADIVCSMYVVTTFASTGAVQGLTIAIYAALGLSLSLRALKAVLGYEVLEAREVMEHETGFRYSAWQQSLRLVAAELLTQAAAWIYSFLKGAITRTRVTPPEELGVRWHRHPGWLTEWFKHFLEGYKK